MLSPDTTVIAAFIAAISAIIAPVITAIVNNRHHYKMRKLESTQDEKIRAIQQYAESCSNYIAHPGRPELIEYSKSYGKIFLYTSKSIHKDIEQIQKHLDNQNFSAAACLLAKVCQDLSVEINI